MTGVDFARQHPDTAARVVIRAVEMHGNVLNAWEVLMSAVGREAATLAVLAQPGGDDALVVVDRTPLADGTEPVTLAERVGGLPDAERAAVRHVLDVHGWEHTAGLFSARQLLAYHAAVHANPDRYGETLDHPAHDLAGDLPAGEVDR